MSAILDIQPLTKLYARTTAVQDLNLSVPAGSVFDSPLLIVVG